MSIFFERHLRTKNIEWFSVINVDNGLDVSIIFNNEDRSKDFSQDKDLMKLKNMDPDLGNEYMKVHVFTKNMGVYKKYQDEISNLIKGLLHHIICTWWVFVYEVEDIDVASEDYLLKWGFDKKNLVVVGNSIYKNLNQD